MKWLVPSSADLPEKGCELKKIFFQPAYTKKICSVMQQKWKPVANMFSHIKRKKKKKEKRKTEEKKKEKKEKKPKIREKKSGSFGYDV